MRYSLTGLTIAAALLGTIARTAPAAADAAQLSPALGTDAALPSCGPVMTAVGNASDFELIYDPNFADEILLTANQPRSTTGPQYERIFVYRLSADTGLLAHDGAPNTHLLATDNTGDFWKNGPEFFNAPSSTGVGLGVLYRGDGGVHAAWRPTQPSTWDDFTLQLDGPGTVSTMPALLPPTLPSTTPRSYPGARFPDHIGIYSSFGGICGQFHSCVGDIDGTNNSMTDMNGFARSGDSLTVAALALHPRTQRTFLLSACEIGSPRTCGIYKGRIDGAGGMDTPPPGLPGETGTFYTRFAATTPHRADESALTTGIVPGRNSVIVLASNENAHGAGNDSIEIWEERADGSLRHVTSLGNLGDVEHFRTVTGNGELVLFYQVRNTNPANRPIGSYAVHIRGDASGLDVDPPRYFSQFAKGVELIYLHGPRARQWASYRITDNQIQRCWIPG